MIVNSADAHNMMSHFWGPNVIIKHDVFISFKRKNE